MPAGRHIPLLFALALCGWFAACGAFAAVAPSALSASTWAPDKAIQPPAPQPGPEVRGVSLTQSEESTATKNSASGASPAEPEQISAPPANRQLPQAPPQGDVWTLDDLTFLALGGNPILRRAEARIESDRAKAWQVGVWNNPRFETNNPQIIGSGPSKNRYSAGFMVDVPMGKKRLDRAAALQQVRRDEFSALSDRYDLLQAVRQNFYAVLAQQQRIDVLRRLVTVAEETHTVARRRYETKQAAEIDVLTLQIEWKQAQAALQQAETLLLSRRRQLAAAVGAPDLPIAAVRGDLTGQPPRFNDEMIRQYVPQRNVDVLNARTEVTRSAILTRRAQIEPILPGLTTGPAAAWFERPSQNTPTQFWYNFRFGIPVLDQNQGNIATAVAYNRDAAASVRATQNNLLALAADALGRHRAAQQRARRIGESILPTAQRAQTLVDRGYRAGLFDVSRVLQAQRALFEANRDYIDALEEVWFTAAELGNLIQLESFP